ncbi:DUF4439 domain-containing protein [Georgenia sp. 311]|uniref:DUF4439 domain-containing protein n=1 Tax=Georgenia sp. 311 TaxID=2585134 RepID=UPI0011118F64|nr:DUF4439 domain-containing protein [Georgenia sp. 311]TNC16727.1 DUF4439 domain-containing protein [Georgenia sp. 311]
MISRRPRTALAAALVAATLAGCGVRLETPPPEVPVADAAETARQEAALAAAELAVLAAAAATTAQDPAVAAALTAVATASGEHDAALGGVWEPWPGAGPDATEPPGPSPTVAETAPAATPEDVLGDLTVAADSAQAGALAQTGELGELLASVAISRTYLAADLAAALGTEVTTLPAAPLPVPEPGTLDPDTSRTLDAARYALVVAAARSTGAERGAAADRADHLAAVAGAVAPEDDRREAAYDLTGVDAEDPAALAAAAELDVVRVYVMLLASAQEGRAELLAAAVDAAGEARSWGAALPALPGLS